VDGTAVFNAWLVGNLLVVIVALAVGLAPHRPRATEA
jgi:hypothetical protein